MTIGAIRDEHARYRVGPVILSEVVLACSRVARRSYPPAIYADAPTWHDAAIDDLVQDVVTDRLIKERQIEFMVDVSVSMRDFRTFLDRQVRITLAKRRQRSVIDNLIDRSTRIIKGTDFELARRGSQPAYHLAGTKREQRDPTDDEIRSAVAHLRPIPRGHGHGDKRAPPVYTDGDLRTLLRVAFETSPTVLRVRDLDRIFRELLTEWTPSGLVPYVETTMEDRVTLSPEDEQATSEAVTTLLSRLDQNARIVLAAKLEGISDADLAQLLGVSRPTAAKRKHTVSTVVAETLGDLPEVVRIETMRHLGAHLAGEAP